MALARVSKGPTFVFASGAVNPLPTSTDERRYRIAAELEKEVPAGVAVVVTRSPKSVTTRSGIVVTLERRPTVDRAWVVCAMSDEMMIDMEVVEGGEGREKVLADMVKKHGGKK